LPAGAPTITTLLEHRKESLSAQTLTIPVGTDTYTLTSNSRSQAVDSAYLEAGVPLVSVSNGVPGIHSLDLQLAVRHDRYSSDGANQSVGGPGFTPDPPARTTDKFSSTDPTVGFRYQPVADVALRASYGTGFLPPALYQLVPGQSIPSNGFGLTDPKRGNELIGDYTLLSGGNPDLQPERSESRSLGAIFTPRFAPGLRVSLDWTQIRKHDNVYVVPLSQSAIDDENLYPGLITRGPATGGFTAGPITEINGRPINVARQTVEAYDLALNYRRDSVAWGTFVIDTAATRSLHNATQIVATTPSLDAVQLTGQKWRANAAFSWLYRDWTVRWTTRYVDSYFLLSTHAVLPNQGVAQVPSQTYHDIAVAYLFASASQPAWIENSEIQLGVRNLFNKAPPLDLNSALFYSTYGDPRLANYYLSFTKRFGK